jgi:hypothetical protein
VSHTREEYTPGGGGGGLKKVCWTENVDLRGSDMRVEKAC